MGNTYGHTTFDAELNGIDVDFKTHSINKPNGKPSPPWVICNDWEATNESIKKNGMIIHNSINQIKFLNKINQINHIFNHFSNRKD